MLERIQWGLMVAEIPQRMPPWNTEVEVARSSLIGTSFAA